MHQEVSLDQSQEGSERKGQGKISGLDSGCVEQMSLGMCCPEVSQDEIDEDILTRPFRLGHNDRLAIAHRIRKWGQDAYIDPFAELNI